MIHANTDLFFISHLLLYYEGWMCRVYDTYTPLTPLTFFTALSMIEMAN